MGNIQYIPIDAMMVNFEVTLMSDLRSAIKRGVRGPCRHHFFYWMKDKLRLWLVLLKLNIRFHNYTFASASIHRK
jgi:hypothetical protein